jgi:transposase
VPEQLSPSPECAACASRDGLIAEQAGMIEELRAANAQLAERVAALERAVGRNSGNSSMPPSTDDLPGRTKPARRRAKGSGRSRGKQPGAPGSTLAWVRDPDERVAHRPQGTCGCGADLAGAAEVGIEHSHQVHDLPEIRIRVRQHDLYRVRCGCGREHVADRPAHVPASWCSYGPTMRSLIVYLLIYQHVPVARCVELIADLTGGTAPSTGFCHGLLARCATAVRETVTTIKSLITVAHVVGFDETTLRAGPAGQKRHVLSASPTSTACSTSAGATWRRSARSGSCPAAPGSRCTTATRTTSTRTGNTWPDTRSALPTCCGTSPTPPSATPTRTGPSRRNARCAG